jgi:hypothetical protein
VLKKQLLPNPSYTMPTLDWLTRREDEQTAGRVPYRLLEPGTDPGLLTLENLMRVLWASKQV